jgi:hypothetical protein
MANHIRRGLYNNCDEKYIPINRCKEQRSFQIDMTSQALTKNITIEEASQLQVEDTNTQTQVDIEPPFPHEEPLISLHVLSGISTPQTLKPTCYIKHWKVIEATTKGIPKEKRTSVTLQGLARTCCLKRKTCGTLTYVASLL